MATVYTLNASATPAPQVPSSLLRPGTDPAVKAELFTTGSTTGVAAKLNKNAAHADNLGTVGGLWAYCVLYGLALTDGGGLTLNIAAGAASIGAVPTVAAAQTKALTNGSQNYVWLLRDGSISLVQNSTAPPANPACYLGRVTTSGGAITAIDGSGVLSNRGGSLYRKTADAAAPTDTPSSALILLTETAGGIYLWDGTVYRAFGDVPTASISVGAEAADTIQVTIQLKTPAGANVATETPVTAWLVDSNSKTAALTSAAPSGGWVAGVGRLLEQSTTNKKAEWVSNSSGVVRIDITEAGTPTWYLVVRVGHRLVISGAITFA